MKMAQKKKSVFETLNDINVNEFTEKKGKYTYLSWSDAITEVLKKYPETTWKVHEFEHPNIISETPEGEPFMQGWIRTPYMKTDSGCFVKVSVCIEEITRTEILAVMDNRNQTMLNPKATDINNSIKRCLTKCLSLFGLGLYIYRGENLPDEEKPIKEKQINLSDAQYKYMMELVKDQDDNFKNLIQKAITERKIKSNNFQEYVKQFQEKNKEQK